MLNHVSECGKPKPCILLPCAAGGHLDGLERKKGKSSLTAIHIEPHFFTAHCPRKGAIGGLSSGASAAHMLLKINRQETDAKTKRVRNLAYEGSGQWVLGRLTSS